MFLSCNIVTNILCKCRNSVSVYLTKSMQEGFKSFYDKDVLF